MSKVIAGEALLECQRFQLPDLGDRAVSASGGGFVTVEELNQIQKQAYDEAFDLGRREGHAAGQEAVRTQGQYLHQILTSLSEPLAAVDDRVTEELVQLAVSIAKHMVRRELKTDPGQVVAIVKEALDSLPVAAPNVRLQLHPEDAALIRETLTLKEGEQNWEIVETPVMTRGGCRVETDVSRIDATVETRITAIVAKLMGGERDYDS